LWLFLEAGRKPAGDGADYEGEFNNKDSCEGEIEMLRPPTRVPSMTQFGTIRARRR
jgi:hypothetical protein